MRTENGQRVEMDQINVHSIACVCCIADNGDICGILQIIRCDLSVKTGYLFITVNYNVAVHVLLSGTDEHRRGQTSGQRGALHNAVTLRIITIDVLTQKRRGNISNEMLIFSVDDAIQISVHIECHGIECVLVGAPETVLSVNVGTEISGRSGRGGGW